MFDRVFLQDCLSSAIIVLTEWNTDASGRRRPCERPTFALLQERLLERGRTEIRSGRFSGRRLARLIVASQPHVQNILNGRRGFSIETADALLTALRISAYDLLDVTEVLELEARRGGPLTPFRCGGCIERRACEPIMIGRAGERCA